jgi:hypothetical protein
MPNWCDNELYVEGDPKSLKAFLDENESDTCVLSFNQSVPVPKEVLEQEKKNLEHKIFSPVVDWRMRNWGTKWDIGGEPRIDAFDDNAVLRFDTANSPPIPWLKTIAKKYPKLYFDLSWEELGNDETGRFSVQGAEVFEDLRTSGWDDPETDERAGYVSCPDGPPRRKRRRA